jgi:hypothetical protein
MTLVQLLLVLTSAAFVGHLGTLEMASAQLATVLANAVGHYILVSLEYSHHVRASSPLSLGGLLVHRKASQLHLNMIQRFAIYTTCLLPAQVCDVPPDL